MHGLKEKKEMQKSLAEMAKMTGEEESIKEQDEIMPVSSQFFILAAGMFIGGYSTLMKYTGVTGNFIKEQFAWWTGQLAVMPQNGKWQDLYMWVPILISLSLVLGGLVQSLYDLIIGKSTLQTEKAEEKKPKSAPDFETEKELEAEHRIDGKVSFENESDFDIEISSEIRRDFDFEMAPETKDDFDVEIDDWQDGFRTEKKEPVMVKPVKVEEDTDWKFDLEPAEDENWRFDQEWEEDIPVEDEEDMEMEERKINYLENPLPLPKKHVKKIMDFEKDIVEAASKDDFDFAIGETDDFDV